jgi:autoinducer 2-degrading protein
MLAVFVYAHVKEDLIEAFKQATLDNASNSIHEPGIARFDVFQQLDDPSHFTLVEIYKTEADPARHRETAHYQRWRDAVASMMVEPRTRTENQMIFPVAAE